MQKSLNIKESRDIVKTNVYTYSIFTYFINSMYLLIVHSKMYMATNLAFTCKLNFAV